MRNTYRILFAELVLTTFISTTLLPSQILFAVDIDLPLPDTTQITYTITNSVDTISPELIDPIAPGDT